MKKQRHITHPIITVLICTTATQFLSDHANGTIVDLGAFGGHEYLYDTGSYLSFDTASLAAQALGAQLVSITSAAENNFLISKITPIASTQLRVA